MGGFGLQYPHINTPTEVAAQQATLGDLLAQKQVRQQQAQENAMKLQQMQQDQQDAQNFTRAYRDSNYDPEKALALAPQYGVSADGLAKRVEAHQKIQQTAATTDDTTLKNTAERGNQFAGYLDPIKRITDPDPNVQLQKRSAAFSDVLRDAAAKKLIDPNDPSIPKTYSDDALEAMLEHAMTAKGYAENALKVKQGVREDAAASEANANALTKNAEAASRVMGGVNTESPQLNPLYMAPGPATGLVRPGNIDLRKLPIIQNPDNTYSTVNSVSFQDEKPGSPTFGKEVLVRGILNGQKVDPNDPAVMDQIRNEYYRTGQHLGVFKDGDAADAYGQRLHEDWENGKIPGVAMRQGDPAAANQPDPKQVAWSEQRALLPPDAQKLVPEQWSQAAEAKVKQMGFPMTAGTSANSDRDIHDAIGAFHENHPNDAAGYRGWLATQKPAVQAYFKSVVPPEQYDPEKSPDALNRSILTPQERANLSKPGANVPFEQQALNTAAKVVAGKLGIKLDPSKPWTEQIPVERQPSVFNYAKQMTKDPATAEAAAANRADARADRSYQFNTRELDNAAKPTTEAAQKLGELKGLMDENSPQAWANVPAKLLSLTAGGVGSGLRINNSLIDQELGGAGKWAQLEGKVQQWSLDPQSASKISDAQKAQMRSVANMLERRIQSRQDIIDRANQDLLNSNNPVEHRKILADTKKALGAVNLQGPGHAIGDVVSVKGKKIKISAVHPDGTFDGSEVK